MTGRALRPLQTRKLLVLCGIIAPVLFAVMFIAAGLLRPGYDHLIQYGSELGVGPNSIIMNANFLATGSLVLAFSVGLARAMNGSMGGKVGSGLVAVFGIGEILAAAFPCDPGCPVYGSPTQLAHDIVSLIAFVAIVAAPLPIAIGLRKDSSWQTYGTYSTVTSVLATILFVLFLTSSQYVGAFQRLFIAIPFVWIEITALRLFDSSREANL